MLKSNIIYKATWLRADYHEPTSCIDTKAMVLLEYQNNILPTWRPTTTSSYNWCVFAAQPITVLSVIGQWLTNGQFNRNNYWLLMRKQIYINQNLVYGWFNSSFVSVVLGWCCERVILAYSTSKDLRMHSRSDDTHPGRWCSDRDRHRTDTHKQSGNHGPAAKPRR